MNCKFKEFSYPMKCTHFLSSLSVLDYLFLFYCILYVIYIYTSCPACLAHLRLLNKL